MSREQKRNSPHMTKGSVLDDLGFSAAEALEIKVKADIYRELMKHIEGCSLTQEQLGSILGIHQPDVSHLRNGRISKFSVGKLIKFAGKMELGAEVRLIKPKPGRGLSVRASVERPAAGLAVRKLAR